MKGWWNFQTRLQTVNNNFVVNATFPEFSFFFCALRYYADSAYKVSLLAPPPTPQLYISVNMRTGMYKNLYYLLISRSPDLHVTCGVVREEKVDSLFCLSYLLKWNVCVFKNRL